MKTAVKMDAKPIQVRKASFPRVGILEAMAEHVAATSVQTTLQPLPPARIFRPWASPMKTDPEARLVRVRRVSRREKRKVFYLHPAKEKKKACHLSVNWTSDNGCSVRDAVHSWILHSESVHDIRVV
jgi:hypothetical protein